MAYSKITEARLQGKGVIGLADTPGLSAARMQAKFEEVARDVIIPAFNRLIDALVADMGNIYTKEEVTEAIREKVREVGAGDMAMYVYDPNGDGIVDRAAKLAQAVKIGNASFDGTGALTLEQIGAAAASHNHTRANITDFPLALKNPNSLTVQFGGNTKATYDGSQSQTVNVTPSAIGAAASGHTHTKSQITDFPSIPSSLKNPAALTLQFNGVTNQSYDGGAARTFNVTPAAIGAATAAQGAKADNAILKTNVSFDAATGTLNITL